MWIEGRGQKKMMEAFGLMSSDMPSVVALNPTRMRFAVAPARVEPVLSAEAMGKFVDGVLAGKARTDVLQVRAAACCCCCCVLRGWAVGCGLPAMPSASRPVGRLL